MSEPEDKSKTVSVTIPETKPEVKPLIPDDSIVVTKTEFANMQKTMIDLQKESDESAIAKTKAERDTVYNELLVVNPKLAKIHEKSSKDVLEGALSAAKEIKTGFTSLKKEKKEETKANETTHSSMRYDFVNKEYVFT